MFSALLDQDCTLCGEARDGLVCEGCEAALARMESACARCAIPLANGGPCGRCRAQPPHFDHAIAALQYRFPVDRLVQGFKYAGDLAIGRWLAERLLGTVRGHERPALLVSPPSTVERLRERGFNPALEIAKVVSRGLGVPCAIEGLVRARSTLPQPGLGRIARERNLVDAIVSPLHLGGLHVAIVDDVMTTGATANAAARALKGAGADRVSVWVVARTP